MIAPLPCLLGSGPLRPYCLQHLAHLKWCDIGFHIVYAPSHVWINGHKYVSNEQLPVTHIRNTNFDLGGNVTIPPESNNQLILLTQKNAAHADKEYCFFLFYISLLWLFFNSIYRWLPYCNSADLGAIKYFDRMHFG